MEHPFLLFFVLMVVGVIVAVFFQYQQQNQTLETMRGMNVDPQRAITTGKYVYGHPDIYSPVQTLIEARAEVLELYSYQMKDGLYFGRPYLVGKIPKQAIQDVQIEDASTIERRVTLGRMAVLGLFAFALKKKKKDELAYLTIKWMQGKFEHETFFEFEGRGAVSMANSARNRLITAIEG